MSVFNWREFLTNWTKQLLEFDANLASEYPTEARETGWLGYSGATEEQIQAAEKRLNVKLPNSYREFLKATNGWQEAGLFIHKLWSVEEIEWYASRHQDLIDAWIAGRSSGFGLAALEEVPDREYFVYGSEQNPYVLRDEYLQTALEIADDDYSGDGVCLLNPKVVFNDGEWEAWFFAAWIPGARRYKSFKEMLLGEYQIFLDVVAQKKNS